MPVPFQPLSSIGIVGGGQLALMLAEAGADLGVDVHVLTPGKRDPAVPKASSVVEAPLDDDQATLLLAARSGAITFENEWIPLERLLPLAEQGVRFVPDLEALSPLISKRGQRQLLNQLHLPSPRWCDLEQVLAPQVSGVAGGPHPPTTPPRRSGRARAPTGPSRWSNGPPCRPDSSFP